MKMLVNFMAWRQLTAMYATVSLHKEHLRYSIYVITITCKSTSDIIVVVVVLLLMMSWFVVFLLHNHDRILKRENVEETVE